MNHMTQMYRQIRHHRNEEDKDTRHQRAESRCSGRGTMTKTHVRVQETKMTFHV